MSCKVGQLFFLLVSLAIGLSTIFDEYRFGSGGDLVLLGYAQKLKILLPLFDSVGLWHYKARLERTK
jgi:hypothetical protein